MTDTTKSVEILTDARELIADESRWIRGVFEGVNEQGEQCFCMLGAVAEAARRSGVKSVRDGILGPLYDSLPDERFMVGPFNDDPDTSHADVLAVFDRAIELASERVLA